MLQTWKRTAVCLGLAVAVGAMCCLPAVAKGPGGGGGGGSTTTPFSVIELSALSSPNAISNPNDGSVTVVGNSGLNAAYWRVNVATRQVTASGSLPQPDNSSTALDVNSSGVIVGAATPTSDSYWAPSRWLPVPSGGYDYQALPLLTGDDSGSAKAINEAGEMVGSSDPPYIPPPPGEDYEVISRAVYWTVDADGEFTVVDLNDWLSPEDSARWVLKEASDINNSGQVVGSGLLDDRRAGVRAGPVHRGNRSRPSRGRCHLEQREADQRRRPRNWQRRAIFSSSWEYWKLELLLGRSRHVAATAPLDEGRRRVCLRDQQVGRAGRKINDRRPFRSRWEGLRVHEPVGT